jgi:hypothetical protein
MLGNLWKLLRLVCFAAVVAVIAADSADSWAGQPVKVSEEDTAGTAHAQALVLNLIGNGYPPGTFFEVRVVRRLVELPPDLSHPLPYQSYKTFAEVWAIPPDNVDPLVATIQSLGNNGANANYAYDGTGIVGDMVVVGPGWTDRHVARLRDQCGRYNHRRHIGLRPVRQCPRFPHGRRQRHA